MILGTYAAAAGTTVINVVGLHQNLLIMPTGGALDATITNVQVKISGDGVLTDINSNAALLTLSDWRKQQSLSVLTAKGYLIPLGDGFFAGKNVQIIITKSGAGTAGTIYGFSKGYGSLYFQIMQQVALANSGINIRKFAFAVVAAPGVTDRFNLTFEDGFNHQADLPELVTDGTWTQVQNDQVNLIVDNVDAIYSTLNVIPAANRDIYIGRFAEPKEISNIL